MSLRERRFMRGGCDKKSGCWLISDLTPVRFSEENIFGKT